MKAPVGRVRPDPPHRKGLKVILKGLGLLGGAVGGYSLPPPLAL